MKTIKKYKRELIEMTNTISEIKTLLKILTCLKTTERKKY